MVGLYQTVLVRSKFVELSLEKLILLVGDGLLVQN